ncbi:MAG: hypothetical protein RIR18_1640 [Pseudomonadota bacterium]
MMNKPKHPKPRNFYGFVELIPFMLFASGGALATPSLWGFWVTVAILGYVALVYFSRKIYLTYLANGQVVEYRSGHGKLQGITIDPMCKNYWLAARYVRSVYRVKVSLPVVESETEK